jgi:hypothetical protein
MNAVERAMSHEAGHAVVGLHFGFRIDGIDVKSGRPRTECHLDSLERSNRERFVFLAGGIASEKVFDSASDYDHAASGNDQSMITERGGGSIAEYLPEALRILHSREKVLRCLKERLCRELVVQKAKARMRAIIGSGSGNSFRLLAGEQIKEIWAAN